MVCRLLIAAAVVAAAAAVGEYDFVLGGACGCGLNGVGIQTYNLTAPAYCPTNSYPTCDRTKMIEQECTISCPQARSALVFRNNSALWQSTDSIKCTNGVATNSLGQTLFNVMRPTCGFKAACDACSVAYHPTCAAGSTCKSDNLDVYTASDSCERMACKDGSTLKLYDTNGAPIAYQAKELFCTVVGKWTNYSLDGSSVGGSLIDQPFTANCVLPKACEECVAPQSTTDLSKLPTPFRTGYTAGDIVHTKEAGSCSTFRCASGFTLYGFSGTSTTVTGREYTNKDFLKCDGNSRWTNGGNENTPNTFLVACLKPLPPCTTCAQNLITVLTTSPSSRPMEVDETTTMPGDCAVRTFVCPGEIQAYNSPGAWLGTVPADAATGKSTLPVVCNAAGNAWEAGGSKIVQVECTAPATTTLPPTTTANPCGPYDDLIVDGPAAFACKDGQNRLTCTNGSKTEIMTAEKSFYFEKMTFVVGKGWLGFDCTGEAKLFKNSADIAAVTCADG